MLSGSLNDNSTASYARSCQGRSAVNIYSIVADVRAQLVNVNNPDKVLFVGEALVGNEAVDQLGRFDKSLRSFSGMGGKSRGIDGIILTKFDTIGARASH